MMMYAEKFCSTESVMFGCLTGYHHSEASSVWEHCKILWQEKMLTLGANFTGL